MSKLPTQLGRTMFHPIRHVARSNTLSAEKAACSDVAMLTGPMALTTALRSRTTPENSPTNLFTITGGWKGIAKNGTLAGQPGARFDDTALNPSQAENVDVAPTAMRLLGLEPPRDNKGRVLTEAFKGW